MNDRHAYLIIAHKVDHTLITLLRMIDHRRNDIFVHMDRKNKDFSLSELSSQVKESQLFLVPERLSVVWGGSSQIDAELSLFSFATSKGPYLYYHLISGQDLPIKSQEYIHSFFDANVGKEFIMFCGSDFNFGYRTAYYHIFQNIIGRDRKTPSIQILRGLQNLGVFIQKLCGVRRHSNTVFYAGSNWVSVTDKFATDLVRHKDDIKRTYRYTICCDEVYKQTFAMNEGYGSSLFDCKIDGLDCSFMRAVDWKRGNPYVWRTDDFDELKSSGMLFARKFDADIDKGIIDKLSELT